MSKQRAARAGAWSALDIVLRQGVQFVVSIVLARLLTPADFGLIALLTFFTSLSITFVQGGLALALVQRQNTTREEETAVFWVNIAASIVFAVVIILIAPAAARFYGQPPLRSLMVVAAAQVVVSALGAVHAELLTRTLRFDQITKAGLVSSLLSAVAGMGAAGMGLGVWALAIQMLVQAAVGTTALWWVSPWRPQRHFRLSAIRDLYGFGAFISMSSVLEVVYSNGFALVLGKVYGLTDLGILNRAFAIQGLPTGVISQVIARTALPLFSARVNDQAALLRGFRMAISLAMVVTTPMLVGLALLSDSVIATLYGPHWVAAAPMLSIVAFGGILLPLHVFNLQLLLALGHSKRFFSLEIQKKVAGVLCIGTGCFFGITGVAYASCVLNVVSLAINARPTGQVLNFGAVRQLRDLAGVFAATAFMSVVVLLMRRLVHSSPPYELMLFSLCGIISYVGFGIVGRLSAFAQAVQAARLVMTGRPPTEVVDYKLVTK